jgi:hypothetical protein
MTGSYHPRPELAAGGPAVTGRGPTGYAQGLERITRDLEVAGGETVIK